MPRCSYKEGRARCPKNATKMVGDQGFCRAHHLLMTDAGTPGGGALRVNPMDKLREVGQSVLEDFIAGRPLDANKIKSALNDLGGGWGLGGAYAGYNPTIPHEQPDFDPFQGIRDAYNRARGQQRQQQAPPDIDAAELARAQAKARQVLGFGPTDAIDAALLKERHRKLTLKHHPDRVGGSEQRMREINAARDILAATL